MSNSFKRVQTLTFKHEKKLNNKINYDKEIYYHLSNRVNIVNRSPCILKFGSFLLFNGKYV